MALRPITPQTPARVRWETAVTEALAARLECDYGDASGILATVPDTLDRLFQTYAEPDQVAAVVDTITRA
jgi:hypothetical protein